VLPGVVIRLQEFSFASGKAEFISWILRAKTGALG
jgi:hypothetical protein